MSFVIGPPPAPSSSSRVITSVSLVGEMTTALPYGRVALSLLGGKKKDEVVEEAGASDFPEEKIVIPVGITPQTLKNYTLYDILGFSGEWGDSADTEVIKKAYHKAVLLYHPDKAQHKTADGKEDRSVFLKIQEAFNVLTNDQKRRTYDSQLPFDERIPAEEKVIEKLAKGPHKFFKLFAPVFQRNARFAVKKPVPDLGDLDTPVDQVYKFYAYWVRFESWRDFTGIGAEHRPDDATDREEKRWMIKENEKIAKKLKKKEMERIISLVTLAEKYDPRIRADKDKRRQEKENAAQMKENAEKMRAEEEAAAKAWAEAADSAAKESSGTATKAEKEKTKKQQSRCRNILRKLLRFSASLGHGDKGEYGVLSTEEVEQLCATCTLDDLNEMNDAMGGEPASKDSSMVQTAGFDVVKRKLERAALLTQQAAEDELIAKEAKKKAVEYKAASERAARSSPQKKGGQQQTDAAAAAASFDSREWTAEETAGFALCTERYGPSFASRFELMANYMNVKFSPSVPFSPEETLICAYRLSTQK